MGNLLAMCTAAASGEAESKQALLMKKQEQERVLRVVRSSDGKILEFRNPILVRDLLAKYPDGEFYVGLFKEATQPLPLEYKLKIDKMYYLIPSSIHHRSLNNDDDGGGDNNNDNSSVSSSGCGIRGKELGGGVKRVKIVITKEQLQELLLKQGGGLEDVLLPQNRVCMADEGSSNSHWLPKLGSIPEGNELVC